MRILQIHNTYRQRGGEDAIAEAEASLLAEAGHQVERLIVPNPVGAVAATARLAVSAWNPAAARRVGAAVAAFRPDVAHVHNTWYSLTTSALRTLRSAGVPTVMTLHNYRYGCLNGQLLREGTICELCLGGSTLPGVRYRCYRNSLPSSVMASLGSVAAHRSWERDVDRFVVMTDFARGRFVAAGLPENRFIVKPHHVSDPGPRSTPPDASATVLFVGRLAAEKGIDLLIEAWRLAELEEYELMVVGDGPLRTEMAARAPASVQFTGWLPVAEVRQVMLRARALVFPSIWYETFGLVMVEAMAAGLPVIASDLGGTPEVIGNQSVLVPAGDVAAWADRLRTLVPDREAMRTAGLMARERYESRFTPAIGLERLESLYSHLVVPQRRGPSMHQ